MTTFRIGGVSSSSTSSRRSILVFSFLFCFFVLLLDNFSLALPTSDTTDATTITSNEDLTLPTDLVPPSEEDVAFEEKNVTLFIINLYAVKNSSDDSDEVLDNNLKEKLPEIIGPFATIFLLVEENDNDTNVDLNATAKYLEDRGFSPEKIEEDGETKFLTLEVPKKDVKNVGAVLESSSMKKSSPDGKSQPPKKYRAKRMACKKCGHGGGGRGGGYGYGHGGGGGYGVAIPVYVVPVQIQPSYHKPSYGQPSHYPSGGGGCYSCNGGGGGGGNAWATASASAGSWGK